MLTVEHLHKEYQTHKKTPFVAVDDVSFELRQGEILAFLGPNGAGKTTTIKMLLDLIVPDAGKVSLSGQILNSRNQELLRNIGAVLEGSRNLYWRMSPLENFEYWGGIRGIKRKEAQERGLHYLKIFEMEAKKDIPVKELSRGMQQIVAICCALVHQPQLLLLDEPTLGLDVSASEKIEKIILQLAHEEGLAILLTTHEMPVAQHLSDEVIMIDHGKIVFQSATKQALADFSNETYELENSTTFDAKAINLLQKFGITEQKSATVVLVTLEKENSFADFLSAIAQLPLLSMKKVELDLATLFKTVMQKGGAVK